MSRKVLPLLLLAAATACSPAYIYRSAAGHAGLLWRRRSIQKTIDDLSVSPDRRERLKLVLAARRFAVERLALASSRDYSTWTPVEGSALTGLVYACSKTSLTARPFHFPFIGAYPYKGHFRKDLAEREAAALEKTGLDAAVMPAAAYNTPLPVSDPLPSTVLDYSPGDLAELLIHEYAHGTVYFKSHSDFDEALASWIGACGADLFLIERFGANSPERLERERDIARAETRAVLYEELGKLLEALYASAVPDAEKLEQREEFFAWARSAAQKSGVAVPATLNNAVVAAHRVYRGEPALFETLFEGSGRDWARFIAALKTLDRKDPWAALRNKLR